MPKKEGAKALEASMTIKLGKKAKEYICLTGKDINYKRSSVKISGHKDSMEIAIKADDPRALLASANSVLKQLRIISEVDSLLDKGISNV